MGLDAVVGLTVLVFALHGFWRGLLRKLAGLASLVIATVAAGYIGSELAAEAARRWQISSPVLSVISIVVGWLALFIACRLVLGFLAKHIGSDASGKPARWNRWLGALFGAVEAGILWWFLVGALDAIPEDLRAGWMPRVHQAMARSNFAAFTHETSPLAYLELKPLVADAAVLAQRPDAAQLLGQEPEIRQLLASPKVQTIVQDEQLLGEIRGGKVARFLADRKVREALEDPEVRRLLRDLSLRTLVHRAAARARQAEK